MAYDSAKRTPLSKKPVFSGGYVDNCTNFDLPENTAPYLRNARFDGYNIVIRPGHVLRKSLTAGSVPQGIGSYLQGDSTNDVVVVRHNQSANHKLVTITEAGVLTSIDTSTNITSDNRMRFVNVGDVIYCMNGVDYYGKLADTTYSIPSVGITNFNPQFGVVFNGSMFTGGYTGYLSAYLTCLGSFTAVTTWAGIANGSFKITIDGVLRTITGINFTGVVSYTAIAQKVQDAIRAATSGQEKVQFIATSGEGTPAATFQHFVIKSGSTTNSSTITVMTGGAGGTDISGVNYLRGDTGTVTNAVASGHIVYKSVGNNYEDFMSSGSDKYTFTEDVIGLCTTNQALFYFTKNTIAVTATSDITNTNGFYSYSNRGLQTVEGAFNYDCIVPVGNNVYYLNSAIQINQIATGQNINGFEVSPLSQRPLQGIQKLMDSLDRDQTGAYGEYVAGPSLVKRHLKSNGATFPDVVVVYDTIKDKFLVDSNKYFNGGTDFHQKHYSISAVEAKVFIDEYGQSDDDSIIPFEYRTKEYYIGDPTIKKILRESRTLVDINELASITQDIRVDGVQKDTKTIDKNNIAIIVGGIGIDSIGEDAIGDDGAEDENKALLDDDYYEVTILRTKGNLNVKGNKIQRRYTNDSLAGKARLKNITAKIEQLDPMTTNLTA